MNALPLNQLFLAAIFAAVTSSAAVQAGRIGTVDFYGYTGSACSICAT